jgi:GNAT superfamily N-acetyltransferase
VSAADAAALEPPDPRAADAAALRRAVRFEQALADRMATRVDRTAYGVARLSPDVPSVYSANLVEVTRPAAPVEVLSDVEARFAAHGLRHRRVTTAVPEVAWALAPALHDRGWAAERTVVMVHDRRTAPASSPLRVGPVDLDRWLAHRRAVVAAEGWGRDPAVQEQVLALDRRRDDRIGVTWVLDDDGAAGCRVDRHGTVAQIEEVNVLAEARGAGRGTALMAAAMAVCADAGLLFLVADADDWPQRWYARLGFRPVGSGWGWTRLPAPGGA